MKKPKKPPVSQAEAEGAVRTLLLRWAGEDPAREGLLDTPQRVVDAYRDWFSGYATDPHEYLSRTFEEVAGYDEMVVLRDIEFESHCEHHMAPIIGRAHVGYLPTERRSSASPSSRARGRCVRAALPGPGKHTAQIAQCIQTVLKPRGVGVVVMHWCTASTTTPDAAWLEHGLDALRDLRGEFFRPGSAARGRCAYARALQVQETHRADRAVHPDRAQATRRRRRRRCGAPVHDDARRARSAACR